MAEIDNVEAAQAERDSADQDLSAAVTAELDRVNVDVQHLQDELASGGAAGDPQRLIRVTEQIKAGTERVRALVAQVGAEDPVPDFPATQGASTPVEQQQGQGIV